MLKPEWMCKYQFLQVVDLLWMMTQNPIGERGVESYLNGLLNYSQYDWCGASVDWWRRLRVSYLFWRSKYQI